MIKVKTEKQPKQLGVRWWKDFKRYSGDKADISRLEYIDCLIEIIKQTLNHVKVLKARKKLNSGRKSLYEKFTNNISN